MKKSLFVVLSVLIASPVLAVEVFQSTYSATSQFDRPLCKNGDRGYLHSICIVDAVAASSAAVFNTTFTVTDAPPAGTKNLSGTIDGSEVRPCLVYDLPASNGLYIDQFGAAGVVVEYDCYKGSL